MTNKDKQITFNRQFLVDLSKTAELNVEHIRLLSDVNPPTNKLINPVITINPIIKSIGYSDKFIAFNALPPK